MIFGGLDLETTGLKQEDGHRIVEVALVLCDDTGKRLGAYTTRINPQRPIDPKAQEVHGIAFEDVIDCPLWENVAPKLSLLMSKCDYIVAHNGEGFDIPFVLREFVRVGVSVPTVRLVDTMLQGRWATAEGALPNLGALCFACGVPYDKALAHGATYDVEVMLACFFKQWPRGFFQLPGREFSLNKEPETA